ncbi:MAG: Competence protein ComM [Candidatus Parcubacteria bacterium]|jgi:DNA invertase Pin-like site-specific DNA recombinase
MEVLTNGIIKPSTNGIQTAIFRVAIYARTSTLAQADEDKISIPDQIKWAKDICEERGWEFIGSYQDTLPGDTEFEQRPDGYKLLEDARFKLFNLVLFYHSSRLAREPWVGLKTISLLGKLGVQVYLRNAPMEPTLPHNYVYGGNVAHEYLNALSLVGDKQENVARSERVTSGFKNLAQRGTLVFAPYGLKKIAKIETRPDGKQEYTWHFESDPIKTTVTNRIFNEYLDGKSLRKIVHGLIQDKIPSPSGKLGLGSWTAATVKNILSNPAYIKKVRWGRKLGSKYRQGKSYTGKQKRVFTPQDKWSLEDAENVSDALIEESVFYKVQERLRQRGKAAGRQLAADSLLAGLVWCGECNRRAYLKTRRAKKDGRIYVRSDFIDSSYFRALDCRRHLMSSDKLEHLVLTKLQSRLMELQERDIDKELSVKEDSTKTMLSGKLGQLDRQIKTYEMKQSRLMELYLASSINKDGFDVQKLKLDSELTILMQERTRIQGLINNKTKQREALNTLKQLLEMFVRVSDRSTQKEMIYRIIDNVVIHKDYIEIVYKYGIEPTYGLNVKPHPCGYLGDKSHTCSCTAAQILRYQKKLSGPILDRIDIHLDVPAVKTDVLSQHATDAESSHIIRKRVQKAREKQRQRFSSLSITNNAEMATKHIKEFCQLSQDCLSLMRLAITTMHLSARSYYRTIKLARTIADIEGGDVITPAHIAESLQYRPKAESLH